MLRWECGGDGVGVGSDVGCYWRWWWWLAEVTDVPGTGMGVVRNSRKFRVLYGSLAKLTEAPDGYINVVPVSVPVPAPRYSTKCRVPGIYPNIYRMFQVFTLRIVRVRVWHVVPVPRVLWHGRT